MKQTRQWINWRLEPRPNEPKPAKVPFDAATGERINPHDSGNWLTHAAAVATGQPVGFVFTAHDPYFFLDVDACLVDGAWASHAAELVGRFPGAMVEVSWSGKGLHVFGSYAGARPEHGTRHWPLHLELYTAGRFVAMGAQASGDPDLNCTAALHGLVASHFPKLTTPTGADWTSEPRDDWTGTDDDAELIRKARAAAGASAMFGSTASFEALWTADESVLSVLFQDPVRDFDRSRTDMSLARHLAFWTGGNCDRIERLMWQSALSRDKWQREAWLQQTIATAVASTGRVYDYVKPEPAPCAPNADGVRLGYQFLTIPDQIQLFEGYMYVISRDRVMLPDGRLLNKSQFNAVTPSHDFARDSGSSPKTTRKAWEAYTESQGFNPVITDAVSFDPLLPWDKPVERGGMRYANTYRPVDTPRKAGDPAPFLAHVRRLLPNERDQQIILAYMAAVIQHKGIKFQWCPLIQGVEGNGKTLLTSVLQSAIGDRYFHTPQAHDLANKFNSWIIGKLLIGIEDIYVPNERREVIEVIKPLITNGNAIGTQGKGADQETSRSCANFFINSNHPDAIRKTRNDRRFAIFFTAQQDVTDIARDGMGGDVLPKLYNWLKDGGYAVTHDFLATYSIPDELNPAVGCHRAPETSTTGEAIAAGLGMIEQEVIDVIAEGRPGFCAPWVSRSMLSAVLKHDRVRITIDRQREILRELGYIPHPTCPRTNNTVAPDGRKAELWVLSGHLAAQLPAGAVANHYESTQAGQLFNASQNRPIQK